MDRISEPRPANSEPRTAISGQRPANLHRALAIVALLGGVFAAFSGTPYRAQPVAALELAQWIHDHKPRLRIVDVRGAAEFADYHLPRSERGTKLVASKPGETLVIIDDARTTSGIGHRPIEIVRSWFTAKHGQRTTINEQRTAISEQRGRDIYYLRGGVGEWLEDVMSPTQPSELTRYFGGQPRAGGGAPPAVHTVRRRGC